MSTTLTITAPCDLALAGGLPAVVIESGEPAAWRFIGQIKHMYQKRNSMAEQMASRLQATGT